jgi:hypothetical protein
MIPHMLRPAPFAPVPCFRAAKRGNFGLVPAASAFFGTFEPGPRCGASGFRSIQYVI